MAQPNVKLLCWNVRDLNAPARRDAVRDLVCGCNAAIVCFQETKLEHVDDILIASMIGHSFAANYQVLPAVGSGGGHDLGSLRRLLQAFRLPGNTRIYLGHRHHAG